MSSSSFTPLLGSPPPSNFWPKTILTSNIALGVAASGYHTYQVTQEKSSWSGLVVSLLWTATSLFGLYTLRKWAIWSDSHSKQTSSVETVGKGAMGLAASSVNGTLLRLISTLDRRIDDLYSQYCEEENQGDLEVAELEELHVSAAPVDLSPEEQLQQMEKKIDRLIEVFAGDGVKFEALQREMERLRKQLEEEEKPSQQPTHDRSASSVLDQLALIQSQLTGLKLNSSRGSSAASSRESSPLKPTVPPSRQQLQIRVLRPTNKATGRIEE